VVVVIGLLVFPPAIVIPGPPTVDADNSDFEADQDKMAEEKSIIPPPFKRAANEDAEQWVRHFENYCEYRGLDDNKKLALSSSYPGRSNLVGFLVG